MATSAASKQTVVEDSPLSLEFRQGGTWGPGQQITDVRRGAHDETYPIVTGKSRQARDHYNQLIVALREIAAPHRKIELHFRAYNDGAAFRYFIPDQEALAQFEILAERSEFRFPADFTSWAAQYGSFTTAYEKEYDRISLNRIEPGAIVGLPLTLSLGGTTTVALTEANLRDYAGMYVVYESPLMMVSDSSEAYRGAVGTDFIRDVPTSWDETRVLAGEVAEYVVIARRLGKDWYIGAMTNWTPRHLSVSLKPLGKGEWNGDVYSDGPGAAKTPTDIAHSQMTLRSDRPVEIDLAPGGGWTAHLKAQAK